VHDKDRNLLNFSGFFSGFRARNGAILRSGADGRAGLRTASNTISSTDQVLHDRIYPDAKHGTNLSFSEDLAAMLGFMANHQYRYPGTKIAEKPMLLTAGTTNVFVHCDLLKHVMVGDVKAPLLHIVHRERSMTLRENIVEHVTFNPVQCVPLQKKEYRYDRHPTVDRLWRTITVHRRQGVCGVGVSSDDASLSFTIKRRSHFDTQHNSRHTAFVVMKRKMWDNGENRQCYRDYYLDQVGGGGPSSSDDVTSADNTDSPRQLAVCCSSCCSLHQLQNESASRFWATWQRQEIFGN